VFFKTFARLNGTISVPEEILDAAKLPPAVREKEILNKECRGLMVCSFRRIASLDILRSGKNTTRHVKKAFRRGDSIFP